MFCDNKFIQNPISNHRKNYSCIASNYNTIDHVNYPNKTQKVISQLQKTNK